MAKPVRVWIDGCFDLVHFGHANAIRQAKENGDQLVVGVHSDAEITRLKGPPVFNERERYKLLRSIKWVDEVIEDVPYNTTIEIMDKYNCDFCMHGDDIALDENGVDVYEKMKKTGRYKEFKRTEGVSTTDLLDRIIRAYSRIRSEDSGAEFASNKPISRFRKLFLWDQNPIDDCGPLPSEKKLTLDKPSAVSPFSTGGIRYYANAVRIAQFSAATVSEPKPDDVIVYCPGNFDLFHIGHVEFLEKAAKLGTYLIVGVYDDEVGKIESGRMGCIMHLQERFLSVLSCKFVNNVVIDVPYVITQGFLNYYKINRVVVGAATKVPLTAEGVDPMAVPREKGIFERIESGSSITTSTVIERIVRNQIIYRERNAKKQQRELTAVQ